MTKPIRLLAVLAAFSVAGLLPARAASPDVKLITVDIIKVMQNYWKTKDADNQIEVKKGEAKVEFEKLKKELDERAKNFEDARDQAFSNALSNEKREQAKADAQKLGQLAEEKQQEIQQFLENTEQRLGLEKANFNQMHFGDVKDIVLRLSGARGATVVLDVSGRTQLGVSSVLYSSSDYDITNEVITEVNKTKPADFKM